MLAQSLEYPLANIPNAIIRKALKLCIKFTCLQGGRGQQYDSSNSNLIVAADARNERLRVVNYYNEPGNGDDLRALLQNGFALDNNHSFYDTLGEGRDDVDHHSNHRVLASPLDSADNASHRNSSPGKVSPWVVVARCWLYCISHFT